MATTGLGKLATLALLLASAAAGTACKGPPVADCTPSLDRCNGLDDDCDGAADEGFGVGEPCSVGLGACRAEGLLSCAPDGANALCSATAGNAAAEACNGLDDDCDGAVDELLPGCCTPGATRPCGAAADVGICRAGTERCSAERGWAGACLDADGAQVVLPGAQPERCNGLDDDCDGTADEGFNVGLDCTAGTGACFAAGTMACTPDGGATACSVTAGNAGAETCDGTDDDCDGATDEEGAAGCTELWVDGDGDGYGTGTSRCLCAPEGGYVALQGGDCSDALPGRNPGATELCNGVDDDCDDQQDEGFVVGPDAWCSAGLGKCQRWATAVCSADGTAAVCPAVAAPPGVESCDGYDDDCDGETDEGTAAELCGAVPAGQHAQPEVVSCTDRRCVLTCDAGWYEEDGAVANGCECQPDADDLAGLGNDCNAPLNLGSLLPGQQIEHTGTIVPYTDVDHFIFTSSAAGAGTYPWPTGDGYGWWICARFDPQYATTVGVTWRGTGGTPIAICDVGYLDMGGGVGCFNNPNNDVRSYTIAVGRNWSSPMVCSADPGNDTSFYRLQIKGYAAEPAWNAPW